MGAATGTIPPSGAKIGDTVGTKLGELLLFDLVKGDEDKKSEGLPVIKLSGGIDGVGFVADGIPDGNKTGMRVVRGIGLADIGTGEFVLGASPVGVGTVATGAGVVCIGGEATGADTIGAAVGATAIGCATAAQISEGSRPFDANAMETFKRGGTLSLVIVPNTSARNPTSKPFSLSFVHVRQAG